VDVGVIIMLGVGGRRFSAAHVRNSITLLNSMNLGERDVIYFSPFFDYPHSEYGPLAAEMRVGELDGPAMDRQMEAIRNGLRVQPGRAPKIAVYDVREFIY
jgi:hypothetical protein